MLLSNFFFFLAFFNVVLGLPATTKTSANSVSTTTSPANVNARAATTTSKAKSKTKTKAKTKTKTKTKSKAQTTTTSTASKVKKAAATTTKKTTTSTKKTTTSTKKTTTSTKTTSTAKTTTTTSKKTTTTTTSKSTTTTTTTSSTATTVTPTASPTVSTGKRGLSFNDPALTDYFSLAGQGSKVSWSYNWASDPYYPGTYTPNTYNLVLNYVPMLWSAADSLTSIWNANVANAQSNYGTDHVLAFNEPDQCCGSCGSSCMSVSDAVAAYKQWVQPMAGKVLLGGPAVTNAVGDGVGISYMEYFMGNCTGCTVDFIPIHWYGSVSDPASFKTYVQSFWTQFARPVWITEFAPSSGTDAQIITFLENVLPWLDQQTYVERYAYFMDNNDGPPHLLYPNNTMTDIGTVYNSY